MNQPLRGRTIVVTRAASQATELSRLLENFGAKVLVCPTIEIREPDNYERLDEALEHLYGYDWLIFTSANGVEYFLRRLTSRSLKVEDLDEVKVCAIGQRTAARLHEAHVHVDLVPSKATGEGVFADLRDFVGGVEQLQGLNVLLPRATFGRDYLPQTLKQAGARVDVVATYQTVLPETFDRGRLSAMLAAGGDCIAFTSPSSIRNLARLFDTHDLSEVLAGAAIACIGSVTAMAAAEYGLCVDIQPEEFTAADLARAIAGYYSK